VATRNANQSGNPATPTNTSGEPCATVWAPTAVTSSSAAPRGASAAKLRAKVPSAARATTTESRPVISEEVARMAATPSAPAERLIAQVLGLELVAGRPCYLRHSFDRGLARLRVSAAGP
jgi:hypothetical protein